jgi:hypothetical protein
MAAGIIGVVVQALWSDSAMRSPHSESVDGRSSETWQGFVAHSFFWKKGYFAFIASDFDRDASMEW